MTTDTGEIVARIGYLRGLGDGLEHRLLNTRVIMRQASARLTLVISGRDDIYASDAAEVERLVKKLGRCARSARIIRRVRNRVLRELSETESRYRVERSAQIDRELGMAGDRVVP